MSEARELCAVGVAAYRVRRQKRIGVAITVLSAGVLAAVALQSGVFDVLATLAAGLFGMLAGLVTVSTAGRDHGAPASDPAVVRLHEGWIEIEGHASRRMLSAEQVEGGWIEETGPHETAVLKTTDGTLVAVRFAATERADAEAVLRAVGADAKAVAMRLTAASLGGRGCATTCLFAAVLLGLPWPVILAISLYQQLSGGDHSPFLLVFAAFATLVVGIGAWLSVRALSSTTLTVGSDGLSIARRLVGRRFVPFERLDELSRDGSDVWLRSGGKRIRVRCGDGMAADTVLERVRQAQSAREAALGGSPLLDLDRAGRTLSAWRAHLAGLLARGGRYRERALERVDLLRVAEDPAASPERRVGAVLALAAGASDDERARLRIAAEACAHRPLRIALASAIDGEIEAAAVEEAMRGKLPERAVRSPD